MRQFSLRLALFGIMVSLSLSVFAQTPPQGYSGVKDFPRRTFVAPAVGAKEPCDLFKIILYHCYNDRTYASRISQLVGKVDQRTGRHEGVELTSGELCSDATIAFSNRNNNYSFSNYIGLNNLKCDFDKAEKFRGMTDAQAEALAQRMAQPTPTPKADLYSTMTEDEVRRNLANGISVAINVCKAILEKPLTASNWDASIAACKTKLQSCIPADVRSQGFSGFWLHDNEEKDDGCLAAVSRAYKPERMQATVPKVACESYMRSALIANDTMSNGANRPRWKGPVPASCRLTDSVLRDAVNSYDRNNGISSGARGVGASSESH